MASCYLNDLHFQGIHQHICDGTPHIQQGYEQLLANADELLNTDPVSIRSANNSPYLFADAGYIPGQDGVLNPDTNRQASQLMGTFGRSTFTLACAWRLKKDPRYAEKALSFIHTWCINEDTRMFATGQVEGPALPENSPSGNITIFSRLPGFFTACYLLDDYRGWGLTAHARVRR